MLALLLALPAAAAPVCFEAAQAVAPDATLTRDDVRAVACRKLQVVPVRYDRASRTIVAPQGLVAADYLGPLPRLGGGGVARGQRLTLRAVAGPAIVERAVTALQAGASGRRIFVRDDEGHVLAVPLSADTGSDR